MRNKLYKILAATFGLALAFIISSCAPSAGERYASERGCRWNYQLQHGWLQGDYAEQVRNNAAAETISNPNCAEVLGEAGRLNREQR